MARRLPKLPRYGRRGGYLDRRSATHLHRGIDLGAPEGTPVYAIAPGVVTHASAELGSGFSGYGGHVVVRLGTAGPWLLYAHLSRVDVRPGDSVAGGQLLGAVGRTCYSREEPRKLCGGAHLHFEVSPTPYPQDSEAPRLDPVAYLQEQGAHPMASDQMARQDLPALPSSPSSSARSSSSARFSSSAAAAVVGLLLVLGTAAALALRRG